MDPNETTASPQSSGEFVAFNSQPPVEPAAAQTEPNDPPASDQQPIEAENRPFWDDDITAEFREDITLKKDLDRTVALAKAKGVAWVVFILHDLPSIFMVIRKFLDHQMSAIGHAFLLITRFLINIFVRKP